MLNQNVQPEAVDRLETLSKEYQRWCLTYDGEVTGLSDDFLKQYNRGNRK
jgi:hypothetical protein